MAVVVIRVLVVSTATAITVEAAAVLVFKQLE